jgi:hypothetical protein
MRMIDIEWWQNMGMNCARKAEHGMGRRESERTRNGQEGIGKAEQGMIERGMTDYYCGLNK